MPATGLSEFTFGFGFLFEQTQRSWGNLKSAPILPSLRMEQNVGWDAHLPKKGTDFYYQFKLTDYLSRPHSLFIKNGPYNSPYFRLTINRKDFSEQHNLLWLHALTHANTFYVAPQFLSTAEYNAAFLSGQVTVNSRLIPLNQCNLINDAQQHYITFQDRIPSWRQHSESTFHEMSFVGEDILRLYEDSQPIWAEIDMEFATNLYNIIRAEIAERIFDNDRNTPLLNLIDQQPGDEITQVLLKSSNLVAAFFGLALVIIGN